MSKPVAIESIKGHKSRKTSGKRGAGFEWNEDKEGILEPATAESLPISTTASTVPAATDQFMHTPEFRKHFVEFVNVQTLMTLRLVTKVWKVVAEEVIDVGVASGAMMVHGGNDVRYFEVAYARVRGLSS